MSVQQENENSADNARMIKIIQKCSHCGEEAGRGNKFCNDCTYAKNRQEMCLENKQINPNWQCKMCGV